MSDLADHIGREVTVEALGKTWTFSRWTRGVWNRLATWAKGILPDPIRAMLEFIDEAVKKDVAVLAWLVQRDEQEKAAAKAEGRPPVLMAGRVRSVADELTSQALAKAASYLAYNSPELQSLLNDPFGESRVLWELLQLHHRGEITEDGAYDLARDLGPEEVRRILKTAMGTPREAPKNSGGPSATA